MENVRPTQGTEPPAVIHDLQEARKRRAEAVSTDDATTITDGARVLARARAIVATMDEVRSERIDALRERIGSGDYTPDAESIARRILDRGV